MAWKTQNGLNGWYDERTQTFVPKEQLIAIRKNNPQAYAEAGTDEQIAASKHGQTRYDHATGKSEVWDANVGSWVEQNTNPNEQMESNLEVLKPDNALNNPIPQNIGAHFQGFFVGFGRVFMDFYIFPAVSQVALIGIEQHQSSFIN